MGSAWSVFAASIGPQSACLVLWWRRLEENSPINLVPRSTTASDDVTKTLATCATVNGRRAEPSDVIWTRSRPLVHRPLGLRHQYCGNRGRAPSACEKNSPPQHRTSYEGRQRSLDFDYLQGKNISSSMFLAASTHLTVIPVATWLLQTEPRDGWLVGLTEK